MIQSKRLFGGVAVQELPKIATGATHADIECAEERVNSADLVEAHFVNELLEDERIIGEKVDAPFPVVETDRSGDDLPNLSRVPATDQAVLVHLAGALFHRQCVPVLGFTAAAIHRV